MVYESLVLLTTQGDGSKERWRRPERPISDAAPLNILPFIPIDPAPTETSNHFGPAPAILQVDSHGAECYREEMVPRWITVYVIRRRRIS
jgi:hypothetical protein